MGVSLERVQNKFACIIGELCNEPIVLSQFAVWLDMRLAEYKAKGSICLECCGDIPKPTWLKGLPIKENAIEEDSRWPPTDDTGQFRNANVPAHTSSRRLPSHNQSYRKPVSSHHQSSTSNIPHQRSDSHLSISSHSSPAQSPMSNRNLPSDSMHTEMDFPSDILVKQEVLDDSSDPVVPVSMHTREELQLEMRKRAGEPLPETSPSRKIQKLFDTSTTDISPLNEPLSSIISDNVKDDSQGGSDSVIEGVSGEQYDQNIDDDEIEILEGSFMQQSGSDGGLPSNSDFDSSRFSQGDLMYSADGTQSSPGTNRERGPANPSPSIALRNTKRAWNEMQLKPRSTVRKTFFAVSIFTKWLHDEYQENRNIETLPPTELDSYLSTFLTTIKRQNGSPYYPKSLKAVREGISRYLHERGYPYSITTALQFISSQTAYRNQYRRLAIIQQQQQQESCP